MALMGKPMLPSRKLTCLADASQVTNLTKDEPEESKCKKILKKRLHILQWITKYTVNDAIADFIAGLTVGLTMMPQSIAYAGLAGMKPEYGLYTAFMGSLAYVFFGTIKEVSIGPTSLMAIITKSYVDGLPIDCMILLTFLAGCVELSMGLFKLGFLVEFISPPITSGFTSASAAIIILAQIKDLLGIEIHSHGFVEMIMQIPEKIPETRYADAILGFCCIAFLYGMKQLNRLKPRNKKTKKLVWLLSISKNAICVFLASAIAYCLHNYARGAPFYLTGDVPKGLPPFQIPSFSTMSSNNETMPFIEMVKSLGSGVVVVPFVAVLANVAIAKSYAADVIVDSSQEMMTLGLCNIFGSCVQAMPSCGAFTRSAVASSSNVRTPLQGVYSASVIILALSLLTPYFFYIPKATLAAVLISAACTLLDYEILPVLWRVSKFDLLMTVMTFLIGVLNSVEISILIGMAVNALLLLKVWTRPNIKVDKIQNADQKYVYIKPELGLCYPTADYLTEQIKSAHNKDRVLPIVLDCENVLRIDYAGVKTLQVLKNTYEEKGIQMLFVNLKPDIRKTLGEMMDVSNLHKCDSLERVCDKNFAIEMKEFGKETIAIEGIPLLQKNVENTRSLVNGNTERKMSAYDNV